MGTSGGREFQITQGLLGLSEYSSITRIRLFFRVTFSHECKVATNKHSDYITGALLSFCSHSHYNVFKVLSETLIFSTFP